VKKFKRKGRVVVSHLSTYEVELLASLVNQLVEMVSASLPEPMPAPDSTDPFELWARELESSAPEPEHNEDPVLQRLFPNAYPHDPEAAADFRRFTDQDLKGTKIAEAQVVLQRLQQTDLGAHELRIPLEEADIWLRTLTSVRLAVATRLGISDPESAEELTDLPDDDPRAFMANIYDWLGFAQETLVAAL
jgi:hypothetical protein